MFEGAKKPNVEFHPCAIIQFCFFINGLMYSDSWLFFDFVFYCVSTSGAQCILIWGKYCPSSLSSLYVWHPASLLYWDRLYHSFSWKITVFFAWPQKKDSNQNAKKTLIKVKVRLFWRQGLLDWQQNCVKSSIDFLLSESWQVLLQVSRPTWYMLPVPILTIKVEKTILSLLKAFWVKKTGNRTTMKMKIIKRRRQFHLFEKLSG